MEDFDTLINNLVRRLCGQGLQVTGKKAINYGVQLKIAGGADTAALNVYNGKKGVTFVVQGSQTPLKDMLQNIVGTKKSAAPAAKKPPPGPDGQPPGRIRPLGLENVTGFDGKWIGIDESGKGDFFGPLVAAAVMVDEVSAAQLEELGVQDSKKLSDLKNAQLAGQIRQLCPDRYAEFKLPPPEYNRLYSQYGKQGKNLNDLLGYAHARTLEDLLEKEPCRFAIADRFGAEKFTTQQLLTKGKEILLVQIPRGERNIAVAAASVLARDVFLTQMKQLWEKFNFLFPKGAVNVLDAARMFASAHGKTSLPLVCKTHFKTYDQI